MLTRRNERQTYIRYLLLPTPPVAVAVTFDPFIRRPTHPKVSLSLCTHTNTYSLVVLDQELCSYAEYIMHIWGTFFDWRNLGFLLIFCSKIRVMPSWAKDWLIGPNFAKILVLDRNQWKAPIHWFLKDVVIRFALSLIGGGVLLLPRDNCTLHHMIQTLG